MNCPKCKTSQNIVKNGIRNGKQGYLCNECKHNFVIHPPLGKPKRLKRLALYLYLEGMGFRALERFLGVSNVAILKWIRRAGEIVEDWVETEKSTLRKGSKLRRRLEKLQTTHIKEMELDELWHYIGKKKSRFGSGWLLIEPTADQSPGYWVIVGREQEEGFGKRLKG